MHNLELYLQEPGRVDVEAYASTDSTPVTVPAGTASSVRSQPASATDSFSVTLDGGTPVAWPAGVEFCAQTAHPGVKLAQEIIITPASGKLARVTVVK